MDEIVDAGSVDAAAETPSAVDVPEQLESAPVATDPSQPTATDEQEPNKAEEIDVLQQIIDSKYKGNKSEFVKGLYEQQNSAAAMYKELKELKAQLTQPREQQPEPFESNEDYASLKNELTVLDQQIASNKNQREAILGSFNSLNRDLAILEGQMMATQDPQQRNALAFQKYQKQQEAKGLEAQWNSTYKDDALITREQKSLSRQLKEAEKAITATRTQQQQQWQEDIKEQQTFLQDFNSAVDDVVAQKGLSLDSPTRTYLYEALKAQAAYHLATSKNKDQGIDPREFVRKGAEAYFASSGQNAKTAFQQASAAKLAGGKPVVTKPGSPQPQKPSAPKFRTGDEAREYAMKRMQALGQKLR